MIAKFLIAAFFCATVAYAIDTTTLPDDTGSTEANTSNCTDAIAGCEKYANTLCMNTVYAQVMYTQCRSTCGMCDTASPCEDRNTNCANWNKNGYCSSTFYSQATRKENCAKTCNLCSTTVDDACADVSTNCANWNKNGFCASASYTVDVKKSNCAKTCNLCGTAATATTKATTTTCTDVNTNCANWNKNGFCASTAYAAATKKANCASTCKLC